MRFLIWKDGALRRMDGRGSWLWQVVRLQIDFLLMESVKKSSCAKSYYDIFIYFIVKKGVVLKCDFFLR